MRVARWNAMGRADGDGSTSTLRLLCVGLVLIAGLLNLSHYGARTIFFEHATAPVEEGGHGLEPKVAMELSEELRTWAAWSPLAGGVAALAIGVPAALVLGAALLLLGSLWLAFGAPFPGLEMACLALGLGLTWVSVLTFGVGRLLAGRRGQRAALVFGLMMAVNLGAAAGPLSAGLIAEAWTLRSGMQVLAGAAGSLLLVAATVVAERRVGGRWPDRPPESVSSADVGRRLRGLLPLLAGAVLLWTVLDAVTWRVSTVMALPGKSFFGSSWHVILSVAAQLILLPAAAVVCLRRAGGLRLPSTAAWIAVALAAAGSGTLLDLLAISDPTAVRVVPLAAGTVLFAVAQVAAVPLLAEAAAGFGERLSALILGLYLVLAPGPTSGLLASYMNGQEGAVLPVIAGVLALVAAAALWRFRQLVAERLRERKDAPSRIAELF